MMNKKEVLEGFRDLFEKELQVMIRAALHARDSATSEEVKSQNKYDTQSIEASYLAGAQAKRAEDLRLALGSTLELLKRANEKSSVIVEGSLVLLENLEEKSRQNFLIIPRDGGNKITLGAETIVALSSLSPLGESLIGRKKGETFEFERAGREVSYEIVEIL